MPPQNTLDPADDEQSKLEVGKQVLSAYTGRRTVLAGILSAIAAVLATNPDTVGNLPDALRSLNNPDNVSPLDVTESVTYAVFMSGFVAEAGNERGSFEPNFALRSEGSGDLVDTRRAAAHNVRESDVDDFGHGGHGFWLQGPLVEVEDTVAAGHRHFAYVFWNLSLVDRPLREGEKLGRRIGNNPNVPVEYVEGQEPLKESEHVEDGKVRASFVRI